MALRFIPCYVLVEYGLKGVSDSVVGEIETAICVSGVAGAPSLYLSHYLAQSGDCIFKTRKLRTSIQCLAWFVILRACRDGELQRHRRRTHIVISVRSPEPTLATSLEFVAPPIGEQSRGRRTVGVKQKVTLRQHRGGNAMLLFTTLISKLQG